jgi:MFS family permease
MQQTRLKSAQATESLDRRGADAAPRRFRALRHRNYRLFWYGQLVSLIGTWMQSVAQQWLVYRLTGSATKLGIVAAAGTLPVLLLSLWAGVLVDRLPKRPVLVATQISAMLLAFALAALVATGSVQFWHIVLLSTLLGCVNAIDMPARQAFTPEMVGKEDLPSAIALNSSVFNGARVIGPSIAGMLVAAVGEAAAFSLNGVSYLAVIAGLLMMRLPKFTANRHHGTPLLDLLDGVRYVARDPLKRVLIAALMVQTIFGTLHMTLMPVFAKDVFVVQGIPFLQSGELRLGLLMASSGVGALTAALMLASVSGRSRSGARIMTGLFLYPIAYILFSLTTSFWLALLLLMLGGWATITLLATCNTLLQTTTPDALRGRVMSLYSMTLVGFLPFSNVMAGFLAERLNSAPLAVRLSQLVVLATAIAIYMWAPRVRQAE